MLSKYSSVFGMESFAWYSIFGICAGLALILALIEAFGVNPWLKKRILSQSEENSQFATVRFDNEKKTNYTESYCTYVFKPLFYFLSLKNSDQYSACIVCNFLRKKKKISLLFCPMCSNNTVLVLIS